MRLHSVLPIAAIVLCSRMVGKPQVYRSTYEETYTYIEQHSEIRDVLISGGDPLTLSDAALEEILLRLRSIPHVKLIRIGSKVLRCYR